MTDLQDRYIKGDQPEAHGGPAAGPPHHTSCGLQYDFSVVSYIQMETLLWLPKVLLGSSAVGDIDHFLAFKFHNSHLVRFHVNYSLTIALRNGQIAASSLTHFAVHALASLCLNSPIGVCIQYESREAQSQGAVFLLAAGSQMMTSCAMGPLA